MVTRQWIERFVVQHNLCPFAQRELERERVRFCLCDTSRQAQLLQALAGELQLLDEEAGIETTFLIHPAALVDFYDFNQFLTDCDHLLEEMDLVGVYQIASFHPHYQFAGTHPDDAENYSNRSPYPMLHILREASVEQAVATYPDVEEVPTRNIETLNAVGHDELQRMWTGCFSE